MKITENLVVSLDYTLQVDQNGEKVIADKSQPGQPLAFIFGSGMLLPEFESNIAGKEVNDAFDFKISAENGYGISDPQQIVNIPVDAFKDPSGNIDQNMLKVGNVLPMQDNHGQHFNGLVAEINDEIVTMDFNHPLADKELHFTGVVIEVREATEEELAHGHVHGPGGHQH